MVVLDRYAQKWPSLQDLKHVCDVPLANIAPVVLRWDVDPRDPISVLTFYWRSVVHALHDGHVITSLHGVSPSPSMWHL